MKKSLVHKSELKLIGITARTKNASEMDPSTAKIPSTLQKYFQHGLFEKIPNRQNPGVTFCVYTNYESDWTGEYTYFVGETVTDFTNCPDNFSTLTISAQHYAKFTNIPGPMPEVCIAMWQNIWKMSEADLGGKRNYLADFEIYDARAQDPANTELDIFIGIKPQ